jgi:hypothetical protein
MKSNKFNKKGYFFVLDVGISIFVLIIGLVIVFSYYYNVYSTAQTTYFSSNIINILSNTRIISSNNLYYGYNGVLYKNGNITNVNNNLMTQIAEFYYRNQTYNCNFCLELIEKTINNVTSTLITDNYYYLIKIDDVIIYNTTQDIKYNESTQLIPSKRIVYGIYNNKEIFGPYGFEVWAWR